MDLLLIASAITFLAAFTMTVSGFSFALVLVPLMSLVYPPSLVVLTSLTLSVLAKPLLLAGCYRQVQLSKLAPILTAAVVGTVLGTRLLILADPASLRLAIGVIVVVLGLPLLLNYSSPLRNERVACLLAGFTSGLLTGSTSMGGPPVVLMGVNQHWDKDHLRANLVAYFTVLHSLTIAVLLGSGVIPEGLIELNLMLLPALALGMIAGGLVFKRVPAAAFRQMVILLVMGSGVVGGWGALNLLLAS